MSAAKDDMVIAKEAFDEWYAIRRERDAVVKQLKDRAVPQEEIDRVAKEFDARAYRWYETFSTHFAKATS